MNQKSEYLSSLVEDAINGDSNSFAIIYLTTYEDIYKKSHYVIDREYDVQDVMFNTYVMAYQRLRELQNPDNLQKWINTIFESQLANQLKKEGRGIGEYYSSLQKVVKKKSPKLMTDDNASQLLESVFMYVGAEPNSIPLESLKSYDSYRNSKTYLQRILLVILILLVMVIPFALMEPKMTMELIPEETTSNQIHYLIRVRSALPVSTVIGDIDGEKVTVMIEGDKIYNATCIKNGTFTITATLINNKKVTQSVEITEFDHEDPYVETYYLENGQLVIVAKDNGNSGIDPENTHMVRLSDGSTHGPTYYDEASGTMHLPYFPNDCGLVVRDKAGNEASYTLTSQ